MCGFDQCYSKITRWKILNSLFIIISLIKNSTAWKSRLPYTYTYIYMYVYIIFAIYSEQVFFQIEYNIFPEPNDVKSLVKQAKHGRKAKFEEHST